jgi:hypothetical protein
MKKPVSTLILCLFMLFTISTRAQRNPVLDSRWVVLPDQKNSTKYTFSLRLQVRCSSPGAHCLNSADFYLDYDPVYLRFSSQPRAGTDYKWAPGFDPAVHRMFKYSNISGLGLNLVTKNGDNLVDICIVDTLPYLGMLLDSGAWVDVADLTWQVAKPGANTQLVWEMEKLNNTLFNVYDCYDDTPVNYDGGDGWDCPFFVDL